MWKEIDITPRSSRPAFCGQLTSTVIHYQRDISLFIDIVSLIGSAASIAGFSLRDFLRGTPPPSSDKSEIENYIRFLEGRNVLLAGMDDEVQIAVIRSLEEIKKETEALRQRCSDERIHSMLLKVILTLSEELQTMHKIDQATNSGPYKIYLSLQRVRFVIAQSLAVLCAAFKIDPSNSRLKTFILDFAVRPR